MNQQELNEIIEKHGKWLRGEEAGERADLRGACLSGAYLRGACLSGAYLRDADLRDAYLRDADLRDADLRGACLSGAYLSGADLSGANLWRCPGNRNEIKSIFASDYYPITYTAEVMQIGCERHEISAWKEFDDNRILEMDGKSALRFWRGWKEIIFTIIEKSPATPTRSHEEKAA